MMKILTVAVVAAAFAVPALAADTGKSGAVATVGDRTITRSEL
jgi:hypothetical protein